MELSSSFTKRNDDVLHLAPHQDVPSVLSAYETTLSKRTASSALAVGSGSGSGSEASSYNPVLTAPTKESMSNSNSNSSVHPKSNSVSDIDALYLESLALARENHQKNSLYAVGLVDISWKEVSLYISLPPSLSISIFYLFLLSLLPSSSFPRSINENMGAELVALRLRKIPAGAAVMRRMRLCTLARREDHPTVAVTC
jgi:hypothetical protein